MAHRLRAVVERLTLPDEMLLGEASLSASGFKDLIEGLAREIDETVLPRRYALFSGERKVATMIASNRRLLSLVIEGRKVETEAGTEATPEAVANTYARALRALSARSELLVLRLMGRASNVSTGSDACSARHLTEFSETPYFKNRLKAFLKTVHPVSQGWIFHAGDSEPVAHAPDPELFKCLTALEQKIRAEHAARNGHRQLDRPSPNLAAFPISTDVQALVVSDGRDLIVAALPVSSVTSAMAHWKTVYGRQKASQAC
ncbi:hypothetical protein [Roseovarius faecimaris]|nr:hypothetical protein [Roseovarius faecimaris]